VNGRGDRADATGFELAIVSDGGGEVLSKEEEVIAARGSLGEGVHGSAERGEPEMVGLSIVPVGDSEAHDPAQDNAEVSIGIEEPSASKGGVGNAGQSWAIAGLEMLGAGFERHDWDSKGQPPAGAPGSLQAQVVIS
jgi:hypothetical protein